MQRSAAAQRIDQPAQRRAGRRVVVNRVTIAGDVEKTSIYSVSGILLNGSSTILGGEKRTIDISALPDGIYLVRVQMTDGRVTWQKVIVRR